MSIWAIVPVKPLKESKSRLAAALPAAEREAISRSFLVHTLEVLAQVRGIDRTLVITRDFDALSIARKHGAHTVTESGTPELNNALSRASEVAASFGAHALMVLAIDLPLVQPADIEEVLSAAAAPNSVVVAPDRREDGTNAIAMHPPLLIPYAFGNGSFPRHLALARERGVAVRICRSPRLALDVDLPEDLELYRDGAMGSAPKTLHT